MRCPLLKDLPSPPQGKNGWPWTEESPHLSEAMSNGKPWPKITIVTPNYNYSQFIEETIRSVLLQGYPNLEYIIVDDGSTDNSIEVIGKYEKWLAYFITQENQGQPNAINRGMEMTTGEIIGYLNSDDLLTKQSLFNVAKHLSNKKICWIAGRSLTIDSQSDYLEMDIPVIRKGFLGWIAGLCHLSQPATFWSREVANKVDKFDERLYYTLDYDFFVRCSYAGFKPRIVYNILAKTRIHPDCKTIKYRDTDFLISDWNIMREKFLELINKKSQQWIFDNDDFQKNITKIKSDGSSVFLKSYYLLELIKLAYKYPWALQDRRWYSCTKHLLLKTNWNNIK